MDWISICCRGKHTRIHLERQRLLCWYSYIREPRPAVDTPHRPPGHNPDKLTVEQVGEGWLLPEWDVLEKVSTDAKLKSFEYWRPISKIWSREMDCTGCTIERTYRTRLTRDELLALIAHKKRLIRVEELPAVCHVKRHGEPWHEMIAKRDPEGQRITIYGDGWVSTLHALALHWQWSSDLKTWHSFEVEDKE